MEEEEKKIILRKKVGIDEMVITPRVKDLSYKDSLRWLFHHYPYWWSDEKNCILLDWQGNIVAIQYNSCENWATIYSEGIYNLPDYIVINNSKRLQWHYRYKDFDNLLKGFLERNFNF